MGNRTIAVGGYLQAFAINGIITKPKSHNNAEVKKVEKQTKGLKRRFRNRIARVIAGTLLVMVIILVLLQSNYRYIQEKTIKSQQDNILNIVTTVADQMESYFETKDSYLLAIAEDSQFFTDFMALREGSTKDVRLVELLYRMGSREYISIELIDSRGALLRAYTDSPNYKYQFGEDVIRGINTHNTIYFVDTLGDRSINLLQPIKREGELYGFIRMQLDSDYLYDTYMADYQLNQKGYISIKDKDGRLLLHPSLEYLGEEVVEVRRRQYPDYDWSELENLVKIQIQKQSGVGVYHSVWPGDGTRVKKINGFTPCNIGDTFIILNFSIDYLETMHSFESITEATVFIAILLVIMSLLTIIYIYIVELKRNELALEAIYFKELKEKNAIIMHQAKFAAMGEMTATIAHQLKQPLNALKISLYNIEDYHLLGEDDRIYLNSLFKSNRRLVDKISKTIDDFKFFFKPQSSSMVFKVKEAVEFALELNVERLNYLEIKANISGDIEARINGESNVLAQVLLNLINNAIDALATTEGIKVIEVQLQDREEAVIVQLQDTGGGVQEDIMAKLFEPYVSTKGESGTGLGLYISKYILREKFDGELTIENTDTGLRATINIPKHSGEGHYDEVKG